MPVALFTPTFLYLNAGLIIWALRFLGAYSITAVACSRGWSGGDTSLLAPVPLGIVASSALSLAGCAAVLIHAGRRLRAGDGEADRFVHQVAALVAAIGALAICWETLPVFFVPFCR